MTELYLRTSIRPEIQKSAWKKGIIAFILAALVVLASEVLLPLLELEGLGMWGWIAGGSACSFGIFSQQRLKLQEKNPNLLYSSEHDLSFFQANKKLFSLAWNQIDSFHFIDNGTDYGLAFKLKKPIEGLSEKSRKAHGVDLFLPYFSHGSYLMLEKWRDQHVEPVCEATTLTTS